jgi:Domain of unknown function (DUF6443)
MNLLPAFLFSMALILNIQRCNAQQTTSSGKPLNFIKIWVPLIPFDSEANFYGLARDVHKIQQNVQYFDGLGRPMQSVSTQGSPTQKDIVQTIVYDAFGRESKKYLPVSTNT